MSIERSAWLAKHTRILRGDVIRERSPIIDPGQWEEREEKNSGRFKTPGNWEGSVPRLRTLYVCPMEFVRLLQIIAPKLRRNKQLPRVSVVILRPMPEQPAPYQIRKSNVHTLSALCQRESIMADLYHITDDKQLLRNQVEQLLKSYHVLMFSGAVSKGKFDYLPEILDELDVNKLFHKVKQRPGKPFWFGKKDRTTVFAFPGNPVSTFVSCLKYFVPWLRSSLEIPYKTTEKAILKANFSFKPELTYFLQVKLSNENGQVLASPIVGNGSGDLANLSLNDAFMELPASCEHFTEGESFPLLIYR